MRIRRIADRGTPDPLTRAVRRRLARAAGTYKMPPGITSTLDRLEPSGDESFNAAFVTALRNASHARLNGLLCRALLTGLWACERWAASAARPAHYAMHAGMVKRGFFGAKGDRIDCTNPKMEAVKRDLLLGYAAAMGARGFRSAHWQPLAPALARLFLLSASGHLTLKDREPQLFKLLQERLRRGGIRFSAQRLRGLACIKEVYEKICS